MGLGVCHMGFCPCRLLSGYPLSYSVWHACKFKLYKSRCSNVRVNFLSSRVVNVWNSLTDSVSFVSLPVFKRTLTTVDLSKFFKCFSYVRLMAAVSVSC